MTIKWITYDPPPDIEPSTEMYHVVEYDGLIYIAWKGRSTPEYFYDPIKNIAGLFTYPTLKPRNADGLVTEYIKSNFGKEPKLSLTSIV